MRFFLLLVTGTKKIRNSKPLQSFVHYKFLPGFGFYGFGLIHMIGGLSRAATSILRQLIDAGTLSIFRLGSSLVEHGSRMMTNLFNLVSSVTLTRLVATCVARSYLCRTKSHQEHWHSFLVCWLTGRALCCDC